MAARHLVALVHADPGVLPKYRAALDALVGTGAVDIRTVNHRATGPDGKPLMSGAYERLADLHRDREGRHLPALERMLGVRISDFETFTLASYSAGYAYVRRVLQSAADYDAIKGVVGIDSWHASLDRDGTAADSQLGALVSFAVRAREAARVCWIGHSDVDPITYASTTKVAAEVVRLAGGEGGGFRTKAWNLAPANKPQTEHGLALTSWGPDWTAGAVAELVARRTSAAVTTESVPPPSMRPLRIRALERTRAELAAGILEVAGARSHPRILQYFAGAERGGKPLVLTDDDFAWCAAGACFCAFTAAHAGESVPHRWRVAVRELWQDALATRTAIAADVVRRGGYLPQPGDLWIGTRGGPVSRSADDPFAATHGQGHVGRVDDWRGDSSGTTIDGNVANTWSTVHRLESAAEFVGIITYGGVVHVPTDEELRVAARLVDLHNDLRDGVEGLAAFERLLREARA
jgi:hypothetical protein